MMKCIKQGNVVVRVKNEVAQQRVAAGTWKYASREEWKKAGRKAG